MLGGQARLAELLDVPYAHLVFTLPHELNALAVVHPRWVYDTLMQCTAATLTEFAANPRWLGGIGAFTLVLHTWTQELRRHLHVHALMACGALRCQPTTARPLGSSPNAHATSCSRCTRCRACSAASSCKHCGNAADSGALPRDPADTAAARRARVQALRHHNWVVYAKTPLAGPAAVLDYLARYTHRMAIGNERIAGHRRRQGVRLRVRADASGAKRTRRARRRAVHRALSAARAAAAASSASATTGCSRRRPRPSGWHGARNALAMPAPNPQAREDAQAFMRRVAAIEIAPLPARCAGRPLAMVLRTRQPTVSRWRRCARGLPWAAVSRSKTRRSPSSRIARMRRPASLAP